MTEKRDKIIGGGDGPEIYKLRLTYSKTGLIRFISHRDLIRVLFRAFSRAGLPVAYSRGYSPHPVVSFCPPLKVGMEGLNERLDLSLTGTPAGAETAGILNPHLPEGIEIKDSRVLSAGEPSLNARLEAAEYRVDPEEPFRVSREAVDNFLAAAEIRMVWRRGGKEKEIDARAGVKSLVREGEGGVRMVLSLKENCQPYPVLIALSGADPAHLPGWRWQRLGFLP
ncbi:MAG: TIGR03936 family radical SAM-associated protein [Candidatus Erginobacter occultus]|nr:TIGR03936 family radical SAM-associated protein [Candidatus Erginobacter occultus]